MMGKIRESLNRVKESTNYLNYGREIIVNWGSEYVQDMDNDNVRILDIGSGQGIDLLNIKNSIRNKKLELFGIECYEPDVEQTRRKGINIFEMNIESKPIPVEDGFFDIVIINQTIEHTKEIFWIFSEISRVVRKGGLVIVGVPNLASLHNRVLLLLGEQPSCMEVLSSHVRGFTAPSFKRFIETDGYFNVLETQGSNFYPFPQSISKHLSKLFPTLSVGIFFLIKRQNKNGKFFDAQRIKTRFTKTQYFSGDTKPIQEDL